MLKKFIILLSLLNSFYVLAEDKFKSTDSVGVRISGGNTDLSTYSFTSLNSYNLGKNLFKLNGNYLSGESNQVVTAENWYAELRYDRDLSKRFGLYFGEKIEADRFAGVRRRYNSDLGAKYYILKREKLNLKTELGFRYSLQKNVDTAIADEKTSNARLYLETDYELSKAVSTKLSVEYISNLSEGEDYLLNIEPSITSKLTTSIAFNTAFIWKYDNRPASGIDKHDYTLSVNVIANF